MTNYRLPAVGQLARYQIRIHGEHERGSWDEVLYCPDIKTVTRLLAESLDKPNEGRWEWAKNVWVYDKQEDFAYARETWLAIHGG